MTPGNSESLTYTDSHRLASATGAYGSLAWTYDASGNRATQVIGGATQTCAISPVSNELTSITQSGAPTRSLTYDASGDRATDTTGSITQALAFDGHGNLAGYQSAGVSEGAYAYDAFQRLVQRVVSNVSPSGATQYYYDRYGHVVLETDQNGVSLREYIWLDDLAVGIIDQVNTTPVLYYVHADWLDRPIMVTDGTATPVWTAIWTPFGTPYSITGTLTYNARFPGQWFQTESGLAWNWHRHYDATTGAYLQPDPLGLPALLDDGPSVYAYVGERPTTDRDPTGQDLDPGLYTPAQKPPKDDNPKVCFKDTFVYYGETDLFGNNTMCLYKGVYTGEIKSRIVSRGIKCFPTY